MPCKPMAFLGSRINCRIVFSASKAGSKMSLAVNPGLYRFVSNPPPNVNPYCGINPGFRLLDWDKCRLLNSKPGCAMAVAVAITVTTVAKADFHDLKPNKPKRGWDPQEWEVEEGFMVLFMVLSMAKGCFAILLIGNWLLLCSFIWVPLR